MRVVFAPDSFKEALGAAEVAEALMRGWRRVFPEAELLAAPMADGGEGTAEAVVAATGGAWVDARVTGPRGDAVQARYGVFDNGAAAVIEMAAASGLPLLDAASRAPLHTTTRGTGELVAHALARGVRRILLGLGGSATNDGGAGFAQALGARLLDASGAELPPGGAALGRLARIDGSGLHPGLAACELLVACDVRNPLCGPEGASRVFGPQKGASPEAVEILDAALAHYARVVRDQLGREVAETPGSGAAGGMGAGLLAFTGARLAPGVELVAGLIGLPEKLAGAALALTGEGRVDAQTLQGKVPAGVAAYARQAGVPVVVVCGALGPGHEALYEAGVAATFCISQGPGSLEEALAQTEARLEATSCSIARLWRASA